MRSQLAHRHSPSCRFSEIQHLSVGVELLYLMYFLGLGRNQNFDPERNPERNSQFFSGIRNSGRISGRPGIRNGIRNLAGNLKNKFIFNKRFEHMIIL